MWSLPVSAPEGRVRFRPAASASSGRPASSARSSARSPPRRSKPARPTCGTWRSPASPGLAGASSATPAPGDRCRCPGTRWSRAKACHGTATPPRSPRRSRCGMTPWPWYVVWSTASPTSSCGTWLSPASPGSAGASGRPQPLGTRCRCPGTRWSRARACRATATPAPRSTRRSRCVVTRWPWSAAWSTVSPTSSSSSGPPHSSAPAGRDEGETFPVQECLTIVLNEEWQHRLYAERDLAVLEERVLSRWSSRSPAG